MRVVTLIGAALLLGGCVGGAGMDSAALRQQAIEMAELRAPGLRVETLAQAVKPPPARHPLHDFDLQMPVQLQGPPARLDDCWVRFASMADALQVGVRCAGRADWQFELPRAFYMHDLQVARWSHRGQPHWVFSARSRNTTGRSALVVTDEAGNTVWRVSLPHAEATRLTASNDGLLLGGLQGGWRQLSW